MAAGSISFPVSVFMPSFRCTYTDMDSVTHPARKSARARLKVKQLNCVLSSLLGSMTMAKHTKRLVGTVTSHNAIENVAVMNETSVGGGATDMFGQSV